MRVEATRSIASFFLPVQHPRAAITTTVYTNSRWLLAIRAQLI